jgi:hypothetical protein
MRAPCQSPPGACRAGRERMLCVSLRDYQVSAARGVTFHDISPSQACHVPLHDTTLSGVSSCKQRTEYQRLTSTAPTRGSRRISVPTQPCELNTPTTRDAITLIIVQSGAAGGLRANAMPTLRSVYFRTRRAANDADAKLHTWTRKKEVAVGCPCRVPRSFGSQPRCWEGTDRHAPANWRFPAKPAWASSVRCQPPPSPDPVQAIRTYRYTIHTSPALTMFSLARRLPLTRPVAGARLFHASAPAFVKVGDKLPNVDLVEGSPGNKVNLAKELTGNGVIIGMSRTSTIKARHLL